MNVSDALEVLGASDLTNFAEIRDAYRELVKRWHPDRHDSPEAKLDAEVRLQKINEAYSFLESLYLAAKVSSSEQRSDIPQDADPPEDAQPGGQAKPSPASDVNPSDSTSWAVKFGMAVLAIVVLSSFGKALSKPKWHQIAPQVSPVALTSPSIAGQWRTSQGDVVRLTEIGTDVQILLISSRSMSSGSGRLRRNGNDLNGMLSGTFKNSSSRQITSPFNGVITNVNRIDYVVDSVTTNSLGSVTSRTTVPFYMIRN